MDDSILQKRHYILSNNLSSWIIFQIFFNYLICNTQHQTTIQEFIPYTPIRTYSRNTHQETIRVKDNFLHLDDLRKCSLPQLSIVSKVIVPFAHNSSISSSTFFASLRIRLSSFCNLPTSITVPVSK